MPNLPPFADVIGGLSAETHVRPEWMHRLLNASQGFIGEALTLWPGTFVGAVDRLADVIAPMSSAESMTLRGRLATIADRTARSRHQVFHRVLDVPMCWHDTLTYLTPSMYDADTTPLDAFRAWGRAYDDAFEASHRWPLAIRAALLLEEAPQGPLDVGRLVRTLGCSRSALTHAFGRTMSVSLREYHLRVRLRRALTMLRESNVTVDAVASMNGYATTEAFHRAFRRVTGLTPRDARLLTPEEAVTLARTRLALGAELGFAPRGA